MKHYSGRICVCVNGKEGALIGCSLGEGGGDGGMVEDSSWMGCGGSVLDLESVLGALCWVGWGGGKEGVLGGTLRLSMDRMLAWVVTFEQSGQYMLQSVSHVQKKG